MHYWLMKSEPDVYSIDDLERDGSTHWDGVRNYAARNNMLRMQVGDLVLFYHSNANPPSVAGIARVCKEAYPDDSQWDKRSKYFDAKASKGRPRWFMVDVEFVDKLRAPVTLETLKTTKGLEDMVVTKRGRLSVQPVKPLEFEVVRQLGGR